MGQFDLGYLYDNGIGVKADTAMASKWYGSAAEGGDPTAEFIYGQRVCSGVGVAKDPVEGLKWLQIATSRGSADATDLAKQMENGMNAEQIAEAKKRAADFIPRAGAL